MRNIKTCLRRRMLIHILGIDFMIVALKFMKMLNVPLVQSDISPITSLLHCNIILIKISQIFLFNISSNMPKLLPYLSKARVSYDKKINESKCAFQVICWSSYTICLKHLFYLTRRKKTTLDQTRSQSRIRTLCCLFHDYLTNSVKQRFLPSDPRLILEHII